MYGSPDGRIVTIHAEIINHSRQRMSRSSKRDAGNVHDSRTVYYAVKGRTSLVPLLHNQPKMRPIHQNGETAQIIDVHIYIN